MKKVIPIVLTLIAGITIGIVYSNTRTDSPPQQSSVAGDDHAGYGHASSEGDGETVSTGTDNVSDWCMEHHVPESVCTKCNPSLVSGFKARNDWCVEHGLPESHCRLCNPGIEFPQEAAIRAMQPQMDLGVSVFFPTNQAICATDGALIQFASTETFARTGLTVEPARSTDEISEIEAPAEVVFDQGFASVITLPVRASVVHWLTEPGEVVREGQMIALCESPEASRIKGEYLEACADADKHEKDQKRQEELFRRNLIDAATYEHSQAEAKTAEARRHKLESELKALGLNNADISEVREGKLSARFALRSPSTGTIVERTAPLGTALEEGTQLATVADPSRVWIEARVRDTDLRRIEQGQPAVFTSEGAHLDRVDARVIWISQYLDPLTRTGIVRAQPIVNSTNLRANQFGHLDFIDHAEASTVLVPRDAVQWEGCCHVVFVREAPDRYRPRKVTIAKADNAHYRVLTGLSADEWVVVRGSFLLKTELKKSSIGAGCCGIETKS